VLPLNFLKQKVTVIRSVENPQSFVAKEGN
jgi:hypothetical protein